MAPRIWAESVVGGWVEAAVKRQKRPQNKKSFMRVAILLLEPSSIPCRTQSTGCGATVRLRQIFSRARRMGGGSAAIKFGGNLAQPVQLRAKLFDHQFDHPNGFMKAMAHFL